MTSIVLGENLDTQRPVCLPTDLLGTHLHLIGATGAGKSSAIQTILRPLMLQTEPTKAAIFIIDPLGNLSQDLLRLIAHPRYATDDIRRRLVYIQPSREDVVLPFNPLLHTSESNRYYQVMRAMDIVLRAWDAQDLSQQPRLANWLFNSFYSAAAIGIPISMCEFLLRPGSQEHAAILSRIPETSRLEWDDILRARGEAVRILESTRNRLKPFFASPNLRRMFGSQRSLFDCERFIRERRIVLLNLGSYGQLHGFAGDSIGALALNEIFETASRLTANLGRSAIEPVYVFMDEFQNYVSPDIEKALPTVRQKGLRLILAHQSFSQLEREDIDLTQMIWQARSRMIFANNAQDADLVADELAKLTFDPKVIKDKRTTIRQIITGHRKEWLRNLSRSEGSTHGDSIQDSTSTGASSSRTDQKDVFGYSHSHGDSKQSGRSSGSNSSVTSSSAEGRSEANVPVHKTFREVSNITYESFDEFALKWGQQIRRLKTGQCYLQLANEDTIRKIQVDYLPIEEPPELRAAVEELKERNFSSEFFISASQADREAEQQRQLLLSGQSLNAADDCVTIDSVENDDELPPSAFEL